MILFIKCQTPFQGELETCRIRNPRNTPLHYCAMYRLKLQRLSQTYIQPQSRTSIQKTNMINSSLPAEPEPPQVQGREIHVLFLGLPYQVTQLVNVGLPITCPKYTVIFSSKAFCHSSNWYLQKTYIYKTTQFTISSSYFLGKKKKAFYVREINCQQSQTDWLA